MSSIYCRGWREGAVGEESLSLIVVKPHVSWVFFYQPAYKPAQDYVYMYMFKYMYMLESHVFKQNVNMLLKIYSTKQRNVNCNMKK